MNPSRRRALKAAALLALPGTLARAQAVPPPAVLGYLPWWMAAGWRDFRLERFNRLVLFDAPIGADGALERRQWQKLARGLVEHAQARSIGLELALTLVGEGDFERVFAHATPRERLLGECTRYLDEAMLAGLHL